MADRRGFIATKFVPHSAEELAWVFERSGDLDVRIDDAAQTIVLSISDYDAHLPVRRGKMHEAQDLVRALVTSRGSGFAPSEATIRAVLRCLDPMI